MYCVYEKVKQLWKRKVWTKDGIGSGAGLDLQYDPSQDLRSIQFYILGFGNFLATLVALHFTPVSKSVSH